MSNQVKLAVVNFPAANPEKTAEFYSKLLGVELTRSPTDATVSYSAPIEDGVYLSVKKKERPDEVVTVFFAVEHLDRAIAAFEAGGGKLLSKHALPIAPKVQKEYTESFKKLYEQDAHVPSHMGSSAVVSDGEGNRIGLIEVHEHAHVMFKMGKYTRARTPFDDAVQKAAKSLEKAFKAGA